MEKILVITGNHIDSNYPNAQCVKQIVNYLNMCKSVSVDIVCDKLEEKEKEVYWYKDLWNTVLRVIYWPSTAPKKIYEKVKQADNLMKQTQYSYIIAAHKPYECVKAAMIIKKKHPEIKVLLYEVDPIANQIDQQLGLGKYLFFLTKRAEKKAYDKMDHIFHMKCNTSQYDRIEYQQYKTKSSYLDFPKIEDRGYKAYNMNDVHYPIKMIYSGIVDKTYRSPEYLLKLLDLLSKELQIRVAFYTKGNCQEDIQKYSRDNSSLLAYGYIPKNELEKKIDEADFLLNIGNKYSTMLPSKVLEYINTGKPIIHITSQKNDACIAYLRKYGNAIIIQESEDMQDSKDRLHIFCIKHYGKRIASKTLCEMFFENTVEYSGKAIINCINNQSREN